jgi:DNA-binding transcriptional LysR family regulator
MFGLALFVPLMKLSSLDLNLLLAFDTLSSERSVTRAAAKLHVSQPAMSGALARLRAHFRDPLFVRQAGQMRPTVRAQQLARPIADAIAALREALEPEARFRPEASTRSFAIAANDYVEAIHFGRLMSAVQREAPGVSLRAIRPPQAFWPPEDWLREGAVDLALGMFAPELRPRADLLSQPLARDRLVAVLRARHPRVRRRLDLRTFLEIPQIRIVYPGEVRTGLLDSELASRGLERRVALTVANLTSVPAIVAGSDLLGVAPERLARAWARGHALRIFDLPIPVPELPLTMVWHATRQNDPGHRWIRERVARELGAATTRAHPGRPRR